MYQVHPLRVSRKTVLIGPDLYLQYRFGFMKMFVFGITLALLKNTHKERTGHPIVDRITV